MGLQLLRVWLLLFLFGLVAIVGGGGANVGDFNIWPMPKSVTNGHRKLYMALDFQLITEGTNYSDASGILKEAFTTMVDVVQMDQALDANFSALHPSVVLKGLQVLISSPNDQLQYGIDESYKLLVPSPYKPDFAHLEAQTVYGALHGLQTFSQLCHFNSATNRIEVLMVPWTIIDQPRFSYRGLLIDTSRHYQPLPMIKKVIDSMVYAKLNVLHWHIVDTQSFPLEIPSYPKLWDGAYSFSERYTFAEAAEIVSYAQRRGINVLAEIDVPGHALSWLRKHGMNESEAYQYFVLRAQKIALSRGYEIVNWEETFNNFGSKLSRKTVVHNWLGGGVAEKVVAAGLRCIVSNQDKWYLDHLDTTWQQFYMNEPLTNITNTEQQKLVIGGEVCMWGERVDGSDIEQTIWPRAAAAAERLWTTYNKLARDPKQVTRRLAHFRCLLNQRGVAAAPLAGPGRGAPQEPGSCYSQ
ncbi:hypothetical protein GH714_016628 [Hevea brasiliensis]|uniref:beta-N-acetylhexosaminidase n=1 Tax=Hevea brasiliensis TaxID=3981 RepID=A0A6A6KDF6_HEVBR|nr:hypothetical protein GH714_016628 [Hevea brasiliensis]